MQKSVEELYETVSTIRTVETTLLELFSAGKLNGTTHAYIGQEANAAGLISHLSAEDTIWSNHRCHGHYLAFTNDVEGLFNELVGNPEGTCGGRGGSQHLCKGNFFTNGVQGSIVPVATGMALAEKLKSSRQIVCVFLGDGTLGEGVVYEAMNIASLWKLPILFVIEHNGYAQTTPSELGIAGDVAARPRSFGLETYETRSSDALELYEFCAKPVEYVRSGAGPAALVMHTVRLCPHSKGDDTRSEEELLKLRSHDPLLKFELHLDSVKRVALDSQIKARVAAIAAQALSRGEAYDN